MPVSIDRQAAQIRRRDELIRHLWQLVIALALIIVVLAVMIITTMKVAGASASCMTKREARAIWPRAHIYWHSADHCWDNRRGRHGRRYKDPLMGGAVRAVRNQVPTKQQIFDKTPASKADKIIDMEKWMAENCCWPDFLRDEDGNIIEPFSHRAEAVPQSWWNRRYGEAQP
jgi:hypothetical protein